MPLLDVSKKEWALAEAFFKKYPNESKFIRKRGSSPRNDPSEKFLDKHKITKLEHSFIKTTNSQIFALKAGTCLGQGGFGKVKIAQNKSGGNFVAKIEGEILSEAENRKADLEILTHLKRFKGEAIRVLQEPKMWLKKWKISKKLYTVIPLIPGKELFDEVNEAYDKGIELPVTDKLQIAIESCKAIQRLHQNGIIHGDIKPENFKMNRDGALIFVEVFDFGLSSKLKPGETTVIKAQGTPEYMAPEVREFKKDAQGEILRDDQGCPMVTSSRGEQSFASDVYSLGIMLQHALGINDTMTMTMTAVLKNMRPSLDDVIKDLEKKLKDMDPLLARKKDLANATPIHPFDVIARTNVSKKMGWRWKFNAGLERFR